MSWYCVSVTYSRCIRCCCGCCVLPIVIFQVWSDVGANSNRKSYLGKSVAVCESPRRYMVLHEFNLKQNGVNNEPKSIEVMAVVICITKTMISQLVFWSVELQYLVLRPHFVVLFIIMYSYRVRPDTYMLFGTMRYHRSCLRQSVTFVTWSHSTWTGTGFRSCQRR